MRRGAGRRVDSLAAVERLEDRTLLSALTVQQIADVNPGMDGSVVQSPTVFDGKLYFGAVGPDGDELYAYDPTTGTVSQAVDVNPGSASSHPESLTAVGDLLAFRGRVGNGDELIVFDPNAAAGSQITAFDISPGPADSFPSDLTAFDDRLFFFTQGTIDDELFVFDPNAAVGNEITKFNINPAGDSLPLGFTVFDGRLFFEATGTEGRELYAFDPNGDTITEFELNSGVNISNANGLTVFDGRLYFEGEGSNGEELYVFDPNGDTVSLVADINTGTSDSSPDDLTAFNGRLFFRATGASGRELYVFDPNANSATLVADINTSGDSDPGDFTAFDGRLFFRAEGATGGEELYALDPTSDVVTQVADINPSGDSSPEELTVFAGQLVFRANSGDGDEVHAFDPVGGQVTQLADINPPPGTTGSFPHDFTEFDGRLFFSTFGGPDATGAELYAVVLTLDATVDAGAATGDGTADTFNVSLDGGDLVVTVGGNEVFRQLLAETNSLTLNGSSDDDTFTVDFSGGVIPVPIIVNGGAQGTEGDELRILGGSFDTAIYNYTNATDGDIQLDGTTDASIAYTGLEPVANSGTATNLVFNLTDGVDQAVLEDDGLGNLVLRSDNNSFEDTTINPAGVDSITINGAGDNDTLTVDTTVSVLTAFNIQDIETANLNADIIAATITGTATTVNVDDPGSIQDGVDLVAAGGTVNVMAGTYVGQIEIDKALTLRGANAGIHPTVGNSTTESAGVRGAESIITAAGTILINARSNDITIDGFTFTGENKRAVSSILDDTDRLHFTNNIIDFTNNDQDVIKLQGGSRSGIVIDYNVFQFTGDGAAIQPEGTPTSLDNWQIANNLFSGGDTPIFQATGVAFSGLEIVENEFDGTVAGVPGTMGGLNLGRAGDASIRDNHFHDMSYTALQVGIVGGEIVGNTFEQIHAFPGLFGQALELWGGEFGTAVSSNVNIANNVIHYNDVIGATAATHGLRLRAPDGGTGIDASTIHVFDNAFINGGVRSDAFAIRHAGDQATTVDAAGNWWDTTDQSEILALTEGSVDFTPYLAVGTDTDTAAGFQGDFSTLYVTTLGTQIGSTGRIQEGVELVDIGGTVNVLAGTYAEHVTVNKAVSLHGAQFGVNPNSRIAGGLEESIVAAVPGNRAFTISASNVTIDGFDLNGAGGGVHGVGEITAVDNTVVAHNFIHDFGGLGVAIAAGSSGSLISGNEIYANYAGVYLSANSANVQVLANEIRGHIAGGGPDQGSAIVFEGNNTNVTVANNVLTNNAAGLYVWGLFGTDFTGTSVSGNSITPVGGGTAVVNNNVTTIDASGNWWGTTDESDIAALMSGLVDFTPYLAIGIDTDIGTAGFQGYYGTLFVSDSSISGQVQTGGRINEAIGLVSTGGFVLVNAGTYNEDVLVGKSLTLEGAQAGVDARIRTGSESNLVGSIDVTAAAASVTIDGFVLTGTGALPLAGVNAQIEADTVFFRNNIVVAVEAIGGYTDAGFVSFNNVTDATIEQNDFSGAFEADRTPNVILVNNASGTVTIQDNEMHDVGGGGGIAIVGGGDSGTATFNITDNVIENTGEGLIYFGDPIAALNVTGNEIFNQTKNGILLTSGTVSGNVTLSNNDIHDNDLDGLSVSGVSITGTLSLSGDSFSNNVSEAINIDGVETVSLTDITSSGNASGGSISNTTTVNLATDDNPNTVDVNAGTVAAGEFVVVGELQAIGFANVATLNINTLDGNDTVNVAAHSSTVINLDGGDPDTAPGDTLNYVAGLANVTDDGSTISTTGKADINYVNFESLSTAPVLVVANPSPAVIEESDFVTLSGSVTDQDDDVLTVTIDWGDGSPVTELTLANGGLIQTSPGAYTYSVTHQYTDDDADNLYSINVTADDGVHTAEQLKSVTVNNVAPTPAIESIGKPRVVGAAIAVSGSATDPAGANDLLSFDWTITKNGDPYATGQGADFSFTPDAIGDYIITLTVSDDDGGSESVSETIRVSDFGLVVAPKAGRPPIVRVYDATGQNIRFSFFAYQITYLGGVKIATGDVNGDSVPDIITAPGGDNVGADIRVFDGVDGTMIHRFFAFAPSFRGGFNVASGDVDGDGFDDIIVSVDSGWKSAVIAFDGQTTGRIGGFFAYGNYRGGVNIAAGDVNGDGVDEILTVPGGTGVYAHVRAFRADGRIVSQFVAFPAQFSRGTFNIAAGDVTGDGFDDVIVSVGSVMPPWIRVFNGATPQVLTSILAYPARFRGGVSIGTGDVNLDGRADILTSTASGALPYLGAFDGLTGQLLAVPPNPYGNFHGGTYVAGNLYDNDTEFLRFDGEAIANSTAPTLEASQIEGLFAAAAGKFRAAGFSQAVTDEIASSDIRVADLAGDRLAMTRPGTIVFDVNAAGWGWFIDETPNLDEEFTRNDDGTYLANTGSAAHGKVDLLTVLTHEIAHELGFDDLDPTAHGNSLLTATLPTAARRATREHFDDLFADADLMDALLTV